MADDYFKLDENGRKLSKKWVENTVGKGEIARNQQLLLFPQCFQKTCFKGASRGVIVCEWVKTPSRPGVHVFIYCIFCLCLYLTLYQTAVTLNDPEEECFKKHFGKKRKCW